MYLSKDEKWYPFEVTKDLNGINAPFLFVVGEGNHAEQPEIYTKVLELFLQKLQKS